MQVQRCCVCACALVCVCVAHALALTQAGILEGLTDSSLPTPPSTPPPLTILVGGTQVAMTPDCFVCPLTSLRGAVVNQALHEGGKQKGGERRRARERGREAGGVFPPSGGVVRWGKVGVGGTKKKKLKGGPKRFHYTSALW